MLWTAKAWFGYNKTPPQIFLCKFLRFLYLFLNGGFQSFLNVQNHFQSWHKVTNMAWIGITLMPLLQYLEIYKIYSYLLEESEVVARNSSMKKVFLKIPQNSQENICAGVSCNIAASWRPETSLKVVSTTFFLVCFLCLKETTCETRRNVFYFTWKALFVLEIIKF